MSSLRVSNRVACAILTLTALLPLDGCSSLAEASQGTAPVRFTTEPRGLVLKLDVGAQRNLVRVFGNGRVVVVQGLKESRQELWLDPIELSSRLDAIAASGLLESSEESIQSQMRTLVRSRRVVTSSDGAASFVEFRFQWADGENEAGGDRAAGVRKRIRWPGAVSIRHFPRDAADLPELEALAETFDWLYRLSRHQNLAAVVDDLRASSSPAALGAPIVYRSRENEWMWISVDGQKKRLLSPEVTPVKSRGGVFMSPDRKLVALRDRNLLLLDLTTGKSVPYEPGAQNGHSVYWSPDGKYSVASLHLGAMRYHLFITPTGGGRARALTDVGALPLSWSPDSSRIYYIASEKAKKVRQPGEAPLPVERNVYTIHPDGSGRRRIDLEGGVLPSRLSFSASGELVAFTDEGLRLFVASVDTITGDVGVARELGRDVFHFDWSPLEERLVTDSYGMDRRGMAVEALSQDDHGGVKLLIHSMESETPVVLREIEAGPWLLLRPQWSPDGQQVLFLRVSPIDGIYYHADPRHTRFGQICVVNADGSGFRVLEGAGGDPHWVP